MALPILGIAVGIGLYGSWIGVDGEDGRGNGEVALRHQLSTELGVQPSVVFVCKLPVVGIAPCVPGRRKGSREVRLTFAGYELPTEAPPDEHARRIARMAYETSTFAKESDKILVIFEEGDAAASVVRTYTFAAGELATDTAQSRQSAE